jgi:metal-sulfur cluster biosynthetic enzyme
MVWEVCMNEDTLNMEIRKYLKKVGVTSQREIEHVVLKAVESGELSGKETLAVTMTLSVSAIGLKHCIEGDIPLE